MKKMLKIFLPVTLMLFALMAFTKPSTELLDLNVGAILTPDIPKLEPTCTNGCQWTGNSSDLCVMCRQCEIHFFHTGWGGQSTCDPV